MFERYFTRDNEKGKVKMHVLVQGIAKEVEQMTKEWQKIKTDAEVKSVYDFINKKNRFEREVKIDYERFDTRNR